MHISAIACTYMRLHAHTCTHSIANSIRKRTQINARKRSLRLTRGRFLRANAIAFCALDLKLSGCTIYTSHHSLHLMPHTSPFTPHPSLLTPHLNYLLGLFVLTVPHNMLAQQPIVLDKPLKGHPVSVSYKEQ